MYELSKQFRFDSAHSLDRDIGEAKKQSSLRIHGHSYRSEIAVRGEIQPGSGMVIDLDALEQALGNLHQALDHRMLNDIPDLGPPTMENLCHWIWDRLVINFPNLVRVSVHRDSSGDSCVYYGKAPIS